MTRLWVVRFVVVLLLATVAGCRMTRTSYVPYSADSQEQPKVVESAVMAYQGDVPALEAAGGVMLGTLAVHGDGFASSDDVRERALTEAAEKGATHVVFGGEQQTVSAVQVSPDQEVTTVNGTATSYGNMTNISATSNTTVRPGMRLPVVRNSGTYYLVRVPASGWCKLPEALQPPTTDDEPCARLAHQQAERERQSASPDRRIVYGDRPMYCSASVGTCSVDRTACTASDCTETTATSCFNYVTTLDDKRGLLCAPSIGACESALARYKTLPDYKVSAQQCGIYRQRADSSPSPPPTSGSDE